MSNTNAIEQKYNMMTQGSVERLVCSLSVPTIMIMLISALYNMADTFFVGQIKENGTSATAAIGISFSIMAVIQSVGFFFGQGSGNYISRQLGAKNYDEASFMAATGLVTSFISGLILGIICLWNIESIVVFLGATPTIVPHACKYLKYIFIAMPFMTGSLTLNNQLRFQGSAVHGMIGIMSGAILNVILDPIFIFVLKYGVAGAGLATLISQCFGFFSLYFATAASGNVRIFLRDFSPKLYRYIEIFKGGFPSLCRQGMGGIAMLCLNKEVGQYGDAALAGMAIATRSAMISFSVLIGFGQGFQPVCGFNYGAKLYDRVKKAFWFLVKIGTAIMTFNCIIAFIWAPQIVAFFRADDPEVIRLGSLALRAQCMAFPIVSWFTSCSMMCQITRQTLKATILAAARQCVFFLPVLFILSRFYGLDGIIYTQPTADLLSFLIAIPIGASVLKGLSNKSENSKIIKN
ncbi:MAG: MATE family efflux transporter [Candidatus Riflebacteria bacterium]|nr:MATE family efflux transporter [Candidatus Riflebacteria bacterium]